MARWCNECLLGCRERHPKCVGNHSRFHFVVTNEAGENRQPGGVGRRPSLRTNPVRPKIKRRPTPRYPSGLARLCVVQLVETARLLLDHNDMAITASFYRSIQRNWVRSRVAFISKFVEGHRNQFLRRRHDQIRNSVFGAGTKVGVQVFVARTVHRTQPANRFTPYGDSADILVPCVVGREQRATAEHRRTSLRARRRSGGALRRSNHRFHSFGLGPAMRRRGAARCGAQRGNETNHAQRSQRLTSPTTSRKQRH